MDSKMIIAVAVVAILAVAGASTAVVLINNNKNSDDSGSGGDTPTDVASAKKVATDFCSNYDGMFGTFTVSDGATDSTAVITSSVKQYINLPSDAGMRTNSVKITCYESADAAATAYATLVTAVKNGSSAMCYAYDAVEIDDASGFGCDKAVYKIGTRNNADKGVTNNKTYSVISGAALSGKYIADFSAWKLEEANVVNLYIGLPIEGSYNVGATVTAKLMTAAMSTFTKTMFSTFGAKDVAANISSAFGGFYGTFTVSEGASDSAAFVTSSVKQYINLPSDAGMRTNAVKITKYDTAEAAATAYAALVSAVNSGSSAMCYTYDAVAIEDASSSNCDKMTYKIGTRNNSDKSVTNDKTYTVISGAALNGKYVIDFSPWKLEEAGMVNLYYGLPIENTYVADHTVTDLMMVQNVAALLIAATC